MTVGILPGPEAVYPFDYVESAQSCFTSCNALAFDDGVRAMGLYGSAGCLWIGRQIHGACA